MTYLFSWKAMEIAKDYYSRPCLFMAFYCLYKNAYFGQGLQLSGNYIQYKN